MIYRFSTLFTKIIRKEIPANIVYEDKYVFYIYIIKNNSVLLFMTLNLKHKLIY